MIDDEVVPAANRSEHRRDHVLGDVLDPLAARANEMVMVLGIAGYICRHMPIALEAASHAVLDLLLERAIDGGSADGRVSCANPVVELLRGESALRRCEGLGDDYTLLGAAPAARGESPRD